MSGNWVILPIAILMLTGVVSLLTYKWHRVQSLAGYAGLTANLGACIALAIEVLGNNRILALQSGDWPAPFGISLVVDGFSAIMLVTAAIVLFATYMYCDEQLRKTAGGLFFVLFHMLGLGVLWSLITADLFNLFVAFEIMLMASYALLVLGTTEQQVRQAYKYVLINLFASMLFVTCCGLVYGHVGTLNFADLAQLSHTGKIPPAAVPAIVTLLVVFGIKTAVFPLWFWLPDTYPTLPAGLGALFGGLLTKVGAYVLIRMYVMVFGPAESVTAVLVQPIMMLTAAATMLLGVLGAVSMNAVRPILSVHIMSQVGYMVLAVALGLSAGLSGEFRVLAVAGGIFFIVHNMVVKSSLFLCGGLMARYAGTDRLDGMGGLAKRTPWLATFFIIAALSLAGLPPLSGFFAKYVLVREAMRAEYFTLVGVALFTSVLTLLSMVKIWSYAFCTPPGGQPPAQANQPVTPQQPIGMGMTAAGLLVAAALGLGLGAEPVYRLSVQAARSVVDPTAYIQAVLGPESIKPLKHSQPADERRPTE